MQAGEFAKAIRVVAKEPDEGGKDLRAMIELCKNGKVVEFTERDAEGIKDFYDLVTLLKNKDEVSPDKPLLLAELLNDIDRKDLAKLFNPYDIPQIKQEPVANHYGNMQDGDVSLGYAQQMQATGGQRRGGGYQERMAPPQGPSVYEEPHCPPVEELRGEDLTDVFHTVTEYIGRDWRYLARRLRMSEFDLDEITEKYPRSLRDQILTMLNKWKVRHQKAATRNALIKALRQCRLNLAADVVETVSVN